MEIKIEIGNWQYNAGIVGLVSILDNFQKNSVRFEENSIYFDCLLYTSPSPRD